MDGSTPFSTFHKLSITHKCDIQTDTWKHVLPTTMSFILVYGWASSKIDFKYPMMSMVLYFLLKIIVLNGSCNMHPLQFMFHRRVSNPSSGGKSVMWTFPLILRTLRKLSSWIDGGTLFKQLLLISNMDKLGKIILLLASTWPLSHSTSVQIWIVVSILLDKIKVRRDSKRRCFLWWQTLLKTVDLKLLWVSLLSVGLISCSICSLL